MKKLVFTLLLFLTAGCAASPKECASIKNSISVSKMEENQKAAQGYELWSTYKRPELLQKKYGVNYCFQAKNKYECDRYVREESIKNGREIRKPYEIRQAELKQMYEDKRCATKN